MSTPEKHDVYISCHYMHDGKYCESLAEYLRNNGICNSVHYRSDVAGDRDVTTDRKVKDVRYDYIEDASVLIVLCGMRSYRCPLMDTEICSAMTPIGPYGRMGILVVLLPEMGDDSHICSDDRIRENMKDPGTDTVQYKMPFPERLAVNIDYGAPISVLDWTQTLSDPKRLQRLIDNAFRRRNEIKYIRTKPMR